MRASDGTRRSDRDECREIGDIADGQRGLITHVQLLTLGLSRGRIDRRRRSGYLRMRHRGVYSVGHDALAPLARELAAVLSCGPGAVLSHQSAAALRGFREPEPDGPVHVTVAGRNPGAREGVVVHRMRAPHPADRAEREGIPVTSPARTLFDLASTLSARELERVFDEARVLCLLGPGALRAALDGHPGCRGTAALRALAAEDNGTTITRSELEERFLALVRRARLPAPACNVQVGAWSVDFFWRAQRVAVELDGFRFHTTRSAFERDREKDHAIRARDIDLLRFTWRQLEREPEASLARTAAALARRGPV